MRHVMTVIGAALVLCILLTGCKKRERPTPESLQRAKRAATWSYIETLDEALARFYLDVGRYPTEEEGLAALVVQPADAEGWHKGGYLDASEVPKDAWGNEFVYVMPSETDEPFVIISYGADGKEGGEGFDSDMWSSN
jgi:type II secretion system protein G